MDYYSNFSGKGRLTKCPFMADTTKFYSYPQPQFCETACQNRFFLYRLEQSVKVTSTLQQVSWWRICLQCRRPGFNPWVRKIPGEGNRNPFQYSCLENPMDRGAWWATLHGITKSQARLSTNTFTLKSE